MAFNGSGLFVRIHNWVNDRDASVAITASRMDAEQDGIATGLTNCVTKDGQTTITANLPMAAFKHTGVGSSNSRTDYADTASVQDGSANYIIDSGVADAYVMSLSPSILAYAAGAQYIFKAANGNTGASTLNISAIGVKNILKHNDQALESGDIESGSICVCVYDGTSMQLVSTGATTPLLLTTSGTLSGTLTLSGNNAFTGTSQFNKTIYLKKGADIASANDLVLLADGNLNDITGTTTINGMTDGSSNEIRHFKVDSALTIKHSTAASSGFSSLYIVQSVSDAALDAGAEFDAIYDGTFWRIVNINLASGKPVRSFYGLSNQSEMEAGTRTDALVSPAIQHYHPTASKAWVNFDGSGTVSIRDSYNVSSITDNGTGDYTINFTNSFSTTNYVFGGQTGDYRTAIGLVSKAVGALRISTRDTEGSGAFLDKANINVIVFGDL